MTWRTGRTLGVTIYKGEDFVATAQSLEASMEIVEKLNLAEAMAAALWEIANRGIYGEGDLPITPSELREVARKVLADIRAAEIDRLRRLEERKKLS